MSRGKLTVSKEDYVKAIWHLTASQQPATGNRLSKELGVTPPAVSRALQRLHSDRMDLMQLHNVGASASDAAATIMSKAPAILVQRSMADLPLA